MRVLTIGTFDLLHHGHTTLFRRAAQHGQLHVGVNSDRFVAEYKGRPPVEQQTRRMFAVARNRNVYKAHLNDGPGVDLIAEVRPGVLVVGSDWLERDYLAQIGMTVDDLEARDLSLMFCPRTPGISTTQLRAA